MSTLGSQAVPMEAAAPPAVPVPVVNASVPLHGALVRITHWIFTVGFLLLVLTGGEIVVSHPRFYWGETGNVLTDPLFKLPIPSSRRLVPTGYPYVLPDQNGWSRSLHFQCAWLTVLTGLVYVGWGLIRGHFRKRLIPRNEDFSWRRIASVITHHLGLSPPSEDDGWSYNVLQRLTYLFVIFVLFPCVIWTGLALSPAFNSAIPQPVNWLGGRQSARTLHFFISIALVLFLIVHVAMVWRAGFRSRMRAMITGKAARPEDK